MIAFDEKEKAILRSLALKKAEIAHQPIMAERRRLWYKHNALQSERPLVLVYPEGAWSEIITDNLLQCRDTLAMRWERTLRQAIYTAESIRDDNVLEPTFDIPWQVSTSDFGVEIPYHQGENRGSYVWEPPLKDLPADLAGLHFRKMSVDRNATMEMVAHAKEIFGDVLNVRIRGQHWWTCGLTGEAIKLVGLENLMLLMCINPEGLHALMKWLSDEMVNYITWFEKNGLLTDMNENDYTGSGGVGYTNELPATDRKPGEQTRLMDQWGFAESQETVGVGPDMFAEFILPYQIPLVEKFGLNCYGCCEPMDQRMHYVQKLPRLRRISISPWSNKRVCAELLGRKYIYSQKPNPSSVCADFDEANIRKEIKDTLDCAGKLNLEIILKDTHTIRQQPQRLSRWVEIAREEIGRFL